MKIYIDADGCPVIKLTLEKAKEYKLECTLICDTCHDFSKYDVKVITVDKGSDSADFRLVNLISKDDIVVTQDYGLAAMCLAKKALVLNQDGLVFDNDNIDSLLLSRHIAKKIRSSGGRLKGPPKRIAQADENFLSALEKLIINNM